MGKQGAGKASSGKDIPLGDPFVYKHLGSMASVGRYKALVDLRQSKVTNFPIITYSIRMYQENDSHLYIHWLAGRKGFGTSRVRKLVHLAVSLSNSSNQLEKQILRRC